MLHLCTSKPTGGNFGVRAMVLHLPVEEDKRDASALSRDVSFSMHGQVGHSHALPFTRPAL
jgi:hypothetical protein